MNKLLDEIIAMNSKSWQSRRVIEYPELVEYLTELYPNYTLAEKIRFYRLGLSEEPRCEICNNILNLSDRRTCSKECRDELKKQDGSFERARVKASITHMKKYGSENPMQSNQCKQKRLDTMIEKYGSYVSDKAREATRKRACDLNKKGRETLKKRHGVDNPGQMSDHRAKCKATTLRKYGVDNFHRSNEYKSQQIIKRIGHWDEYTNDEITIIHVLSGETPTERITYECECGMCEIISHETLKWRIRHVKTACVKCGGLGKGSKSENDVNEWIKSLGLTSKRNTRMIISPKELDIYLPEHNLAIEFNGSYWHSELHGKDKTYHLNKTNLCKDQGIHLIHIWEHDWILKKDLVKSRIKAKLGLNDRVYARKCVLKEINSKVTTEFLNNHHIQGNCPASVRYGLYYSEKLIAVMTFGKSRYKKDVEYELLRYCSKQGVNVTGGASKLFKKFTREYSPASVISYSDRMWNTGGLYEQLGFEYSHSSNPAYYYTKDYFDFENRVIYQKHKLKDKLDIFDPLLTEWENMQANSYDRIWDCGNDVWLFGTEVQR